MECSLSNCSRPAKKRGYCQGHYLRLWRYGSPLAGAPIRATLPLFMSLTERFWYRVNKTESCWLWTGPLATLGYGRMRFEGRTYPAHRLAYILVKGSVPDDLPLDHLCRIPLCVNPDHLEPVTTRINTLRGISPAAQNAVKTHCPQGHPYSETNTQRFRGKRRCATCHRVKEAARRLAKT